MAIDAAADAEVVPKARAILEQRVGSGYGILDGGRLVALAKPRSSTGLL